MYQLAHDITIGKYRVKYLLECEVRKSANKLSDTATIQLPGMAYNAALEVESKIKRGDAVSIKLGYDDTLFEEFKGFVSTIQTDNTITIGCEDSMFLLRKDVLNKQFKDVSASDIVAEVAGQVGSYDYVVGDGVQDVIFDKFTVQDATAWDVLRKVKKETGLHIFFKGNELHTHLKYTYAAGEVTYNFARNVEKSALKYLKESDKKVLIKVVGIDRNNKRIKVEVGEPGGDRITIHRYNVTDETALRRIGKEELVNYLYTGYEGDLTGWLFPYCSYGYSAKIKHPRYPEREGRYYVNAVTTRFSRNGGERKLTL